ncbi:hypothetical protein [Candidatus Synchoanobacter obligatus]|uniref:Alpha/beta hydrolase family protein n=1 Tax=Candidatus Synchoanobacter obligatus TaxID=2919597 RepID=A0ABT1L4C0_9GAMM|nr:hypothetical protein [Candidatus Synchoanobacter obligatus]MCP8352007.1 hypothetical protein [Candidatus Synchoanobacter obligatus]
MPITRFIANLIRLPFFPLRLIWTAYLFPLQFKKAFSQRPTHPFNIRDAQNNTNNIDIFIPGRDTDPTLIQHDAPDAFFFHKGAQLLCFPPPSFSQPYFPLSITSWSESIREYINKQPADKTIYLVGHSLGGLATGTVYPNLKDIPKNVHIIFINSFKSLFHIIWYNKTANITLGMFQILPAAITMFILGLTKYSGIVLASSIFFSSTLAILLMAKLYHYLITEERWAIWQLDYRFLQCNLPRSAIEHSEVLPLMPYNNQILNALLCLPRLGLKIAYLSVILLYNGVVNTTIWTLHLSSFLLNSLTIWLMDCHHIISYSNENQPLLTHNITTFQAQDDPIIPKDAMLSKYIGRDNKKESEQIARDHGVSNELLEDIRNSL